VMIDTTNPNRTAFCNETDREREFSPLMYLGVVAAETGLFRLVELAGLTKYLGPIGNLPAEIQVEYVQHFSRPTFFLSVIQEKRAWYKSCNSLPQGVNVFNVPLTVIIPSLGSFRKDLTAGREQALLSADSKYVEVEGATHTGIVFTPEGAQIVSSEIIKLVKRLRKPGSVKVGNKNSGQCKGGASVEKSSKSETCEEQAV